MADRIRRLATAAGVCSPATVLLTLGVGAALATGYDWPAEPFSVIGATEGAAALAFNAGLVAAGGLALPFAWRLWTARSRVSGGLYALLGASFAVAGLFPMGSPLHAVATVIFLVAWLLPWIAGVADWRAGRRRVGAAQVALGTAALAVWLPYDLGLRRAQVGYGGAELVSILAVGAWSVWTALELWRADRTDGATAAPSTA
ncbi:DUF998 domain-containing protein [Halosimplex marinum]|uniref:DUF998 domain-containing protein n=1 Tax=Halosimplex marinum TaxID=3396620 RepID=UPI003F569BF7